MLKDSIEIHNKRIKNRVVIQPMEGADCNFNGAPSELTRKKYLNFAKSGAGIIWFEACAVCEEGKTNLRQMFLTEENVCEFRSLLDEMREISIQENGFAPLTILQLTHSGRQSIRPMIAYRNPVYEEKRPVDDSMIVSDEYLDGLPDQFIHSARLAYEATTHMIERIANNVDSCAIVGQAGGKAMIFEEAILEKMVNVQWQRPIRQWWESFYEVSHILAKPPQVQETR